MPVVDSNTRLLDTSTVIASRLTMEIQEGIGKNIPLQARLLAVAKESSMDNADVVQIGNTVFVGHRGTGEANKAMSGSIYNSDTGKNFVDNVIKYFAYLQEKNVNRYSSPLSFLTESLPQIVKRKLMNTDTDLFTQFHKDRNYMFVKIGEDSLKGVV